MFMIGVEWVAGWVVVGGRSNLGSLYCINRPPRLQGSVTVDSPELVEPPLNTRQNKLLVGENSQEV